MYVHTLKKKCDIQPLSLFLFSRHRTIKMTPNEVNSENEQKLLDTVYNYKRVYSKRRMAKFRVGDSVRISNKRAVFDKSYTPNWSTAIFTIRKVQYNTDPITYLLRSWDNLDIEGSVYPEELQHVKNPDEYIIEKILKRKDGYVLVRWLGWGDEYNSWIKESDVSL